MHAFEPCRIRSVVETKLRRGSEKTPDDCAAQRSCFLTPLADRKRHRNHSSNHCQTRHQHRPQAFSSSRACGGNGVSPIPPVLLCEGDEQNRVCHGDANRHDGAHETFKVQRCACE